MFIKDLQACKNKQLEFDILRNIIFSVLLHKFVKMSRDSP
jgi:hypothetical protein